MLKEISHQGMEFIEGNQDFFDDVYQSIEVSRIISDLLQ